VNTAVGIGAAALVAAASVFAFSPRHPPALAATSLGVQTTHFNDLAQVGDRLLAAGTLGDIVYSEDQGQHWQAATVDHPRQALLVSMAFAPDKKTGFAVGHEDWILRTQDGGKTWQEVLFQEKNGEPLMSVARLPSGDWITVGAFGKALVSHDGGKAWEPLTLPEQVEDKHLNRIVSSADGRRWLIVGERGLVLHSADGGASWQAETPFYNGSFYGAMALDGGGWLIYGMRGNIFTQATPDAPWVRSQVPAPVSFFGHARQADGAIVLVGQGSMLGISRDGGKSFTLQRAKGRATLTDVLLTGQDQGWIASDAGLQPYNVAAQTGQDTAQGAKP